MKENMNIYGSHDLSDVESHPSPTPEAGQRDINIEYLGTLSSLLDRIEKMEAFVALNDKRRKEYEEQRTNDMNALHDLLNDCREVKESFNGMLEKWGPILADTIKKETDVGLERFRTIMNEMPKTFKKAIVAVIWAAIMTVTCIVAVWQCTSVKSEWRDAGREEGRQMAMEQYQPRIDSLLSIEKKLRKAIQSSQVGDYMAFVVKQAEERRLAEIRRINKEFFQQWNDNLPVMKENARLKEENAKLNDFCDKLMIKYKELEALCSNAINSRNSP